LVKGDKKDKTEYSPKRLNYRKYLVGDSTKNFLLGCGCDPDTVDIGDSTTHNATVNNYKNLLYHLCEELKLNTDQIVKKFKRLGALSYEFEEILFEKCLRLKADVNKKIIRDGRVIYKSGKKVSMFIFAWEKFCKFNNIKIDWDRIRTTIPRNKQQIRAVADDEAYTREQIKKICLYATDIRLKVAILMMSSGGLRREAMCTLLHKHIKPIIIDGKLVCARVVTYNEEEGTYITFITPEAYNLYLEYLTERRRFNEVITDNSPVLIKKFDVRKGKSIIDNTPIKKITLGRLITDVLIASGVRELSPSYVHRYKVKALHGFRKFMYETLRKSGVDATTAHELIGDKTILEIAPQEHAYNRKTDKVFYERRLLKAYRLAIAELTISDEAREKALRINAEKELEDTKTLKLKIEKIESEKDADIEKLKQEMSKQFREEMKEALSRINENEKRLLHVYDNPEAFETAIVNGREIPVAINKLPKPKDLPPSELEEQVERVVTPKQLVKIKDKIKKKEQLIMSQQTLVKCAACSKPGYTYIGRHNGEEYTWTRHYNEPPVKVVNGKEYFRLCICHKIYTMEDAMPLPGQIKKPELSEPMAIAIDGSRIKTSKK
jgi:hypothetical protein